MSFFSCKHPAAYLGVYTRETVEPNKKYHNEYEIITYHLYCKKCQERVDHIGYARLNDEAQAKEDHRSAEFKKKQEEWAREDREWKEWWEPRQKKLDEWAKGKK